MRMQHVIEAVYSRPWMITPAAWYAIHQLVVAHLADGKLPAAGQPKENIFGEKMQAMEIRNGIATIPIKGSLVKGASLFEKSCGAVSHEDVSGDLDDAMKQGVRGILLDFDSPGGQVMGTAELAAKVAKVQTDGTPIMAFTSDLMASAAYYIAAGCTAIFATGSSIVGSIGTIWETYNVAEQLKNRGIEVNVFASGPFKGMGNPAMKLTPQQTAWMQGHVDMLADEFKAHVMAFRDVDDDAMQGQIFTGKQAAGNNLINGNVDGIADVLEMFN